MNLSASDQGPDAELPSSRLGRWTVNVCKDCGGYAHCFDRCPADCRRVWTQVIEVPVVPCDDAAVERAARALGANDGIIVAWDRRSEASQNYMRSCARAALRAAGETEPRA